MSLHAVDFSGSVLNFRFIDINASVTINLESGDFVFIPGFSATDSIARINIPKDYLSNLFKFRLSYTDLSNSNWTNIKYAMNEPAWNDVAFSMSKVNTSKAINPNAKLQYLQYDYIRYLLREITGSIYTNGLFRNKDELLTKVIALDAEFNTNIKSVLTLCGTELLPLDNTTYYNNPCHVLLDSILAQDNVLETDNAVRRSTFLNSITNTISDIYTANVATKYYIYGKQDGDTTYRYFYPLYLQNDDTLHNLETYFVDMAFTSQLVGNSAVPLITDSTPLIDLSGISLYRNNTGSFNVPPNDPSIVNYYTFYNTFLSFPFEYGDSLSVRLTYKPKNNMYLGKEIKDRSYEVYLDVGLDFSFNVLYDASGSEGLPSNITPAIPESFNPPSPAVPRTYQSNGVNLSFQYVLFNASPPNLYLSPYNFYPTLSDIKDISFNTYVETSDVSTNWFFSIFTRPRNKGLTDAEGVGFDRFNSVPVVGTLDTWNSFNLTNLKWDNNLNSQSTWTELLNMPISSTTPYGTVSTNGDQQIMALAIATKVIFTGKIKEVVVTFNDNRYIFMS
jgi:hypothetical protein